MLHSCFSSFRYYKCNRSISRLSFPFSVSRNQAFLFLKSCFLSPSLIRGPCKVFFEGRFIHVLGRLFEWGKFLSCSLGHFSLPFSNIFFLTYQEKVLFSVLNFLASESNKYQMQELMHRHTILHSIFSP